MCYKACLDDRRAVIKIQIKKVVYDDEKAFWLHENIPQDQPYDGRNGPAQYGAKGNAKNYTKEGTRPKYLETAAMEVAESNDVIKYFRDSLGRFKKRKL